MVQITASPPQLLIANSSGGAIFIFEAKIGLKSTKNVVFCIRLLEPPPPRPPGYATACIILFYYADTVSGLAEREIKVLNLCLHCFPAAGSETLYSLSN